MDNTFSYFSKRGKGPNVLFLHGWQQDRHTWDGVVTQLQHDFTCWTLDLPGFGQNPRPTEAWSIQEYAEYVQQFIDHHKLHDVSIVGHSFGGRIAIVLGKDTEHIKQIVLYATPGFREALPLRASIAQAFAKAMQKTSFGLDKTSLYKSIRNRFRSRDFRQANELQDIFLNTIKYDLKPSIATITVPTLLVWGEVDSEVPIAIGHAMQKAIPNSVLKTMPQCSHFAHLENPTLFSGIVRNFLLEHK